MEVKTAPQNTDFVAKYISEFFSRLDNNLALQDVFFTFPDMDEGVSSLPCKIIKTQALGMNY